MEHKPKLKITASRKRFHVELSLDLHHTVSIHDLVNHEQTKKLSLPERRKQAVIKVLLNRYKNQHGLYSYKNFLSKTMRMRQNTPFTNQLRIEAKRLLTRYKAKELKNERNK